MEKYIKLIYYLISVLFISCEGNTGCLKCVSENQPNSTTPYCEYKTCDEAQFQVTTDACNDCAKANGIKSCTCIDSY